MGAIFSLPLYNARVGGRAGAYRILNAESDAWPVIGPEILFFPLGVRFIDMGYRFSAMLHIPGDVRDAIAFYQRAFGATTGWSTPPAEDMVAQLLVHGAEFWVHPAGEAIGNPPPQPGGTAVRLMLIVDDPDAVFDRAVAAGAVVRSPMQDRDYGWRDGSVVDPFGHRWEIGKPL